MKNDPYKAERRYLLIAAVGNALIGGTAIVFSFIASSQAILLDGLFNLAYFATGLFTLRVARLVQLGDDEDFPFGYGYFEPLINGVKGILVFGVTMMAFVGAVEALLTGGRSIAAGPAIIYGSVATLACCVLAFITHRGAKRTGSPLIRADAENWIVNGAVSAGVLIAFVGVLKIQDTALAFLAPYIDPVVVLLVIALSISVPVRIAWQALMELLNRAPRPEIVKQVRSIVEANLVDLPVKKLFVRVVQPGRTRMVLAHVVLPDDYPVDGLATLDALRAKTQEHLRKDHSDTSIDMVFTTNPDFGAPCSEVSTD